MMRYLFVFFSVVTFQYSVEANDHVIKRNLQDDWKVFSGGTYIPFAQSEEAAKTVYLFLNTELFKGDYIAIEGSVKFSVFIQGTLVVTHTTQTVLSLDSIGKIFNKSTLLIAIHGAETLDADKLHAYLYTPVIHSVVHESTTQEEARKPTYFRDFVITAVLFLFIFLIALIQLNPRLSSDYFSIPNIFSLREGDDDRYYFRLTSANILFYVYTSLALSFFLLIVNEFNITGLSFIEKGSSFYGTVFIWGEVAVIILSFFLLKILVLFILSYLFNVKEVAGYQFFNFIRILLVFASVNLILLTGYYLLHGQNEDFYIYCLKAFTVLAVLWSILLFLKLGNRIKQSPIHLFSYICATEILPSLIVIKILYE